MKKEHGKRNIFNRLDELEMVCYNPSRQLNPLSRVAEGTAR